MRRYGAWISREYFVHMLKATPMPFSLGSTNNLTQEIGCYVLELLKKFECLLFTISARFTAFHRVGGRLIHLPSSGTRARSHSYIFAYNLAPGVFFLIEIDLLIEETIQIVNILNGFQIFFMYFLESCIYRPRSSLEDA